MKLEVPILGIVENMSGFTCPHCGKTTNIFGRDGAANVAERLGIPLLGRVPLVPALVEASDRGNLYSAIEKDPQLAEVFRTMALQVSKVIATSSK